MAVFEWRETFTKIKSLNQPCDVWPMEPWAGVTSNLVSKPALLPNGDRSRHWPSPTNPLDEQQLEIGRSNRAGPLPLRTPFPLSKILLRRTTPNDRTEFDTMIINSRHEGCSSSNKTTDHSLCSALLCSAILQQKQHEYSNLSDLHLLSTSTINP